MIILQNKAEEGKITKHCAQCCSFLCNFVQFCPVLFSSARFSFSSLPLSFVLLFWNHGRVVSGVVWNPRSLKAMRLFLMFAVSRKRQISPVPMKRQMQRNFCFLETQNLYSELSCASFSQICCYKMRTETDHCQNKSITQNSNNNLTE